MSYKKPKSKESKKGESSPQEKGPSEKPSQKTKTKGENKKSTKGKPHQRPSERGDVAKSKKNKKKELPKKDSPKSDTKLDSKEPKKPPKTVSKSNDETNIEIKFKAKKTKSSRTQQPSSQDTTKKKSIQRQQSKTKSISTGKKKLDRKPKKSEKDQTSKVKTKSGELLDRKSSKQENKIATKRKPVQDKIPTNVSDQTTTDPSETSSSQTEDQGVRSIQTGDESESPEITDGQTKEEISTKKQIPGQTKKVSIEEIRDQPFILARLFRFLLRPLAPPLPVKKMLLPKENHLDGKLIIYFSEGQLAMGLLTVLLSVPIFILTQSFGALAIFMVVGSILSLTASGSEEIHVTNSRVLVRRINLLDRIFRVPRDSQYLIEEIVSFEIRRAPINRLLFIMGIIPLFLLFFEDLQIWYLIGIIITISLVSIVLSLRLTKRSLDFNMSGGHTIQLGIQKGVPIDLIDSFTEIVLEKKLIDQTN